MTRMNIYRNKNNTHYHTNIHVTKPHIMTCITIYCNTHNITNINVMTHSLNQLLSVLCTLNLLNLPISYPCIS